MVCTDPVFNQPILIGPGSPVQNVDIERFNGSFAAKCLNARRFESLEQARQTMATSKLIASR